jgi:PAS domain S-box-containing protein
MSGSAAKSTASTLHDSLATLQDSAHLGVVTANLDRVIDANDAFLNMIRYTREELEAGVIDWRAMTPPDSFARDQIALEQLRRYGASVPFEKEYILRDGTHLPMMMGAIRLREEPLEWMCYVIDLTDRKRAEDAEKQTRELLAKQMLVNRVAHELNNPLEALFLLTHALQANSAVAGDAEARRMLTDAEGMLARIASLTRAVLDAGQ